MARSGLPRGWVGIKTKAFAKKKKRKRGPGKKCQGVSLQKTGNGSSWDEDYPGKWANTGCGGRTPGDKKPGNGTGQQHRPAGIRGREEAKNILQTRGMDGAEEEKIGKKRARRFRRSRQLNYFTKTDLTRELA